MHSKRGTDWKLMHGICQTYARMTCYFEERMILHTGEVVTQLRLQSHLTKCQSEKVLMKQQIANKSLGRIIM